MDYDKTEIAKTYSRARHHGPDFLQQWMDAVAAQVAGEEVRTILDLGCGTGRFSEGLAAHFNARVVGIDPSGKMISEAQRNRSHSRVFYGCGTAEALPLETSSVDVIFLSMVFHHFRDPGQAARECARVLRRRGRVFLRTGSRERIPQYAYVPYFPGSRPLLEQTLPTLPSQCEVFERASFRILFSAAITQQIAKDYQEYAGKISLRADSVLVRLADKEFDAGVAALRAEKKPGPIVEPIDFVVFERES